MSTLSNHTLRALAGSTLVTLLTLSSGARGVAAHAVQGQRDAGDHHFEYVVHDDERGSITSFNSFHGNRGRSRILRDHGHEAFWFSIDDRDYEVTDHAWVGRARAIVKPMQELGERQGALGAAQSRLGEQQAAIGEEQARLGEEMGRIGARMGAIATRASWNGRPSHERDELERQMEKLRGRMDRLNERRQPLDERQEALGDRQRELGFQQQQLSDRAGAALEQLARDAIRAGVAQPDP